MTRQQLSTAAAVLGVLLLAGPAAAGQASTVSASEASAFMGTWVITLGTGEQTVIIRDEGGQVSARLEGFRGGPKDITETAKDGDSLVLTWDVAGPIDRVLTLTVDGEMINAAFESADGPVNGTGKKQ